METSREYDSELDLYPHGLFFVFPLSLVAPIFLVLALVLGQTPFAIFLLIVISLGIGLRVWSQVSAKRLIYETGLDRRVIFPDESVTLNVSIENNKPLPVLIKVRLLMNPDLTDGDTAANIIEESGILWYQRIDYQRCLTPRKRGVFATGAPKLITGDFFGFFPRQTASAQDSNILVYPRLCPIRSFAVLKQIMFGKASPNSPIHDPIYILGTKDYQYHSPGKNIHWKASARLNRLREKIFEPTEREKITIVFEVDDFIETGDEARFETAIEVMASLGVMFEANQYSVGFVSNCEINHRGESSMTSVRKSSRVSEFLERLARLEFASADPIETFLGKRSLFGAGASCVFFPIFRYRVVIPRRG